MENIVEKYFPKKLHDKKQMLQLELFFAVLKKK